jgi:pyridoxamine 5'-phosphate oxidase
LKGGVLVNFKDCIGFASENPICYLATEDGVQPRVRAFRMWFADESGFYFHTGSTKDVFKQIERNPRIEVCFCSPDFCKMMRVTGRVEILDSFDLKERLLEERTFLKSIIKGPDDPLLTIFRIPSGEAHFWTIAENMKESEIPRIRF